MANSFTRHIPNTLTCLNLFSGCVACVMAFEANYLLAGLFIVIGATFDFFDGMSARLLHAPSAIGKDLDSLADCVSFGVAPAIMVFSLLKELPYPEAPASLKEYIPYTAFLIAIFSALRLAKFNNDSRQTSSFIGLPTPANALFWASLIAGSHDYLISFRYTIIAILALTVIFSLLLVSEIPMFALKFKNLSWKENRIRFFFVFVCVILILLLQISGFAACIVWYILLSLFTRESSLVNK